MRLKQPHIFVTWLLFAIIMGAYLLMAVKFPLAYIFATYEDLVGEWAQVFLFATTMLLSARLACHKLRERWFFALLALACFYVVGEEISWGQRLFNIATPEFFQQHNLQNETNLHNFFTGPIKSTSKMLLEYLLAAGMIGYGLIYPLLLEMRRQPALWLYRRGIPFPPLYLWPFFTASAFFELGHLQFNEAELAEMLVPLALALMALNYLQAIRQDKPLAELGEWPLKVSRQLSRQTVLLAAIVLLLAGATTTACYFSPRLGPGIRDRFENGIEKFAGRYQRQQNWPVAAELYSRLLQHNGNKAETLRQLFNVYSQMGETDKANQYLQQAEQRDLDFLASNSLNVAAHLSIARTYELMGKTEDAEDHRRGSLEIARLNQNRAPKNSAAAYWLGQALEATAAPDEAQQAYRLALELSPGTLKARRALQRLTSVADDSN